MLYPSISIITCSFNADLSLFTKVLKNIAKQNYPKNKIEHIVMDGGSTNGSIELARQYGCRVFSDKKLEHKAESRASIGIKKAKHDLIVFIETDNIIVGKNWFKEMVLPFQENKEIFCTYSAFNTYEKSMSFMTKYCALFGIPDPTLYYLKKTEKVRMDQSVYDKGQILDRKSNYTTVRFNKNNLPTLGDNGHMFRKSTIFKVNKNPDDYVHVDAFAEMLDQGHNIFGVVHNSIIHVTKSTVFGLVKQRVGMKQTFYDGRRGKRKYLVYNPNFFQDRINLYKYIFFSLTFFIPFFEAVRGYSKIREKAWFLHPVMCFLMVMGYGISEIQWMLKKQFKLL